MPTDQESSNVEHEPESTDELSSEELDQVVGGTDPKPTPPTRPVLSDIVISKIVDVASSG